MSRFDLELPLPATKVSLETVRSLHKYLIDRAVALAKDADDINVIRKSVKITIDDAIGSEEIESLDTYAPVTFSDSTESIEVSLERPFGTSLSDLAVGIRLHRDRIHSRVRITCNRPNSRELAVGLEQGVRECIRPHESGLGWLHPRPEIQGALIGAVMVGWGVALVAAVRAPGIWSFAGVLAVVGIAVYLWVLPRLRPFVEFDSRITRRRQAQWRWCVRGIAGFLVFGVAASVGFEWLLAIMGS